MTVVAAWIDQVTRGYLASNQLSVVLSGPIHLKAPVITTMTLEERAFSWLWCGSDDDEREGRALLVNRLTGTLFDPETGQALNSSPRMVGAPFAVPKIVPARKVPAGVFSTAQV